MAFGKKAAPQLDPVALAQAQRAREQAEVQVAFQKGITALRDFIAPSSIEFSASHFQIGTRIARTYYVYGFPRQVFTGWLSSMINMDEVMDLSMFIYPVESQVVLENLRKKVSQIEAGIQIDSEKGRVRDPGKQAMIQDAEEMRDKLQVGEERFFRFGLYFTIFGSSMDELEFIAHKVESVLGQQLVYSKPATSQQEQGLNSTVPQLTDQLAIKRNFSTGALSTTFPFTSADLTQDSGILYGINMHNSGLVIFDRFSLENGNAVVFAKSGAGKSFTVKLEALRSMMYGTEIFIIDPENEYQRMAEAVGGAYVRLSLSSPTRINPFDLPKVVDSEESDNALRSNLITSLASSKASCATYPETPPLILHCIMSGRHGSVCSTYNIDGSMVRCRYLRGINSPTNPRSKAGFLAAMFKTSGALHSQSHSSIASDTTSSTPVYTVSDRPLASF